MGRACSTPDSELHYLLVGLLLGLLIVPGDSIWYLFSTAELTEQTTKL
jgi:hypothetical protein